MSYQTEEARSRRLPKAESFAALEVVLKRPMIVADAVIHNPYGISSIHLAPSLQNAPGRAESIRANRATNEKGTRTVAFCLKTVIGP